MFFTRTIRKFKKTKQPLIFVNIDKFKNNMGLFRRNKNTNKPVIRQILDLIPPHLLQRVTQQYQSDKGCSKYKTYDQLVALLFGQLCRCSTLEDDRKSVV